MYKKLAVDVALLAEDMIDEDFHRLMGDYRE